MIRAALFDFGGVILSSPFDAFAALERDQGLPEGFIRRVNATDPHDNAWAQLERSEIGIERFCTLFEAEARALGHEVRGADVLGCLGGEVRPAMVAAVQRCGERLRTGLLTNNFVTPEGPPAHRGDPSVSDGDGSGGGPEPAIEAAAGSRAEELAGIVALFDVVVESSVVGVRKPDPRFYGIACERLSIEPEEAVFLDDLGVNLKPARAMGMTTIKVTDPAQALAELESVVGFPLT